jgi:[ribosomal protein S18]-alanine N-acetyltransferase
LNSHEAIEQEIRVKLRLFERRDLAALHAVDQACFPEDIAYDLPDLDAFISHRNSETWVAVVGRSIVGFLVAALEAGRVAHIVTIDVLAEYRRYGIGSLLMATAERWASAKGMRKVYLETAEDNPVAQEFYLQRGYQCIDRIEDYYRPGLAAWVLLKVLA